MANKYDKALLDEVYAAERRVKPSWGTTARTANRKRHEHRRRAKPVRDARRVLDRLWSGDLDR